MSGDRREDDYAAIAWPGFVDVLSSALIMFVFFVLITAVALYFHVLIYKSTINSTTIDDIAGGMRDQIRSLKQTNAITEAQKETLEDQNKQLSKEIARYAQLIEALGGLDKHTAQSESEAAMKIEASMADAKDQQVRDNEAERTVVIIFGSSAISLQKDRKADVEKLIKKYMTANPNYKVTLLAGKQPNTLTENAARKLAVARLLNARNVILDQKVPSNRVTAHIEDPQIVENSYNWVKITFSE